MRHDFRAAKRITGNNAVEQQDSVPKRTVRYLSSVLPAAHI